MNSLRTRLTDIITTCLFSIAVTACGVLAPYEAELGQGNFIRQEQFDQLQIDQTTDQVQFLLGTPLLTGEFTEDRWIYPTQTDGEYSNLIIEFSDHRVSNFYYQ